MTVKYFMRIRNHSHKLGMGSSCFHDSHHIRLAFEVDFEIAINKKASVFVPKILCIPFLAIYEIF